MRWVVLAVLFASFHVGVMAQGLPAPGSGSTGRVTSGDDANKITIGRLAQVTKGSSILTSPSLKARRISYAKEYQYLVVNKADNGSWYSVVLVNGSLGYIPADRVVILPYDVQVPKGADLRALSNRSGDNLTDRSSSRDVRDKLSMIQHSFKYVGTPYKWGGNDLENGIDCSAFVQQLFGMIGEKLPRTAAQQAKVGQPIERLEDLLPGDRLYFWDKKRGKIGHTGIFIGVMDDGLAYFIHSSSNNDGVAVDTLNNQKWLNMLVAARRD